MNIWKVGITGGMGAGKTTVAQIFSLLGIPVYNADIRAKQLMGVDEALIIQIKALLGPGAYTQDGKINTRYIAGKVFSDDFLLKKLNTLVHPKVLEDGDAWHHNKTGMPYTLKEAALLFESGSYLYLDAVINVFAPEDIRIQRILQRDQIPLVQIKERLRNQWPEDRRKMLVDFEITNDGKTLLIPQIMRIHQNLIQA
jgi:dephospho-CoA kinase